LRSRAEPAEDDGPDHGGFSLPRRYGTCPTWEKFIDRITGGDTDLAKFLQRVIGYSLTGLTTEHALFFCYGTGANGKSVLGDRAHVFVAAHVAHLRSGGLAQRGTNRQQCRASAFGGGSHLCYVS
jgi:hypothetical protein